MDKTANFWNKISGRYDQQANSKYSEAYRLTIEKSRGYLKATDSILDFACGTGITTVEMAKDVKDVYAIDFSKDMVAIAKRKVEKENLNNVSFKVCSIQDETIKDNSFDAVLAFNILYFLDDIDEVLRKIYKILKAGGLFISATDCIVNEKSVLNLSQSLLGKMGIIPKIKKYTTDELESIIKKAGFSIIETENLYSNPPNYFIAAGKIEK